MILALETRVGWMIKCVGCGLHHGHHIIPTKGKLPHNWTFSGNPESPTFSPSMNETCNDPSMPGYNPDVQRSCCHFTVTDGKITYHGGTTHALIGQTLPLVPFTDAEVACHDKEY